MSYFDICEVNSGTANKLYEEGLVRVMLRTNRRVKIDLTQETIDEVNLAISEKFGEKFPTSEYYLSLVKKRDNKPEDSRKRADRMSEVGSKRIKK